MTHLFRFRARLPILLHLLVASIKQWSAHRASSKGAALALYMIFSLAPMLILVIAIAGTFFGEQAVRSELVSQLHNLMGDRGAEVIQIVLASAYESGSGLVATVISVCALVFSATTAFSELKESLDELWEVRDKGQGGVHGLVRNRLLSFGLVLVLALFLLILLTVNTALSFMLVTAQKYYGTLFITSSFAMIVEMLSSVFSFMVVTALFAVIYKLLPNAIIPWQHVIPGAVVTALLFLLGKWGIGLYLRHGMIASAYGAAGSVVALLLWIYYSAQIFFFGAVLTRQYALYLDQSEKPAAAA